jgi:hypothetical protein
VWSLLSSALAFSRRIWSSWDFQLGRALRCVNMGCEHACNQKDTAIWIHPRVVPADEVDIAIQERNIARCLPVRAVSASRPLVIFSVDPSFRSRMETYTWAYYMQLELYSQSSCAFLSSVVFLCFTLRAIRFPRSLPDDHASDGDHHYPEVVL